MIFRWFCSDKADRWGGDQLRDEPLNGEIFHALREAQVIVENCLRH
jgi:hypothetical protein